MSKDKDIKLKEIVRRIENDEELSDALTRSQAEALNDLGFDVPIPAGPPKSSI